MRAILLALTLLVTVLAGCAGVPDPGDAFTTPEPDEEGRYVVTMTSRNTFSPSQIEVPVGSTLLFVSEGGVHDARFDNGWTVPMLTTGDEHELVVDEEGEFSFYCHPHRDLDMAGVLRVVPA